MRPDSLVPVDFGFVDAPEISNMVADNIEKQIMHGIHDHLLGDIPIGQP